eukprot:c9118_g1_i2.p1 GENE.c9118_g1_i2~~c9118_g1_i2.p1  ORF type:complete len:532 (+),score=108.04 c9118_g1_i2:182-1597(+)
MLFHHLIHQEVVTIDSAVIKHILKDEFEVYSKPHREQNVIFLLLHDFIGHNIFTATHGLDSPDNGAVWLHSRKIASGIFTRNNFRDHMWGVFTNKADELIAILNQVPKDGKIDMQRKFFAFTMDSIMQLFFDRKTDLIGGQEDTLTSTFDNAHRSMMLYFVNNVAFVLLWSLLPWPLGPLNFKVQSRFERLWRILTPSGNSFSKYSTKARKMTYDLVREKLSEKGVENQRSLLALFVKAMDEEAAESNKPTLSTDEKASLMCDMALNFILAGRDTTACTLTWAFYMLATNPEVQAKLCQEIDEVLGDRDLVMEDVLSATKLPYLNGVVYEALRLYPPVPEDIKTPMRDDVLPGGIPAPKGTFLVFSPFGMGRDPDRYTDPLKVMPERWIPFKNPSPFDFPVFQAGPRICLGLNMALMEAKVVIVKLLRNFTFSLLAGEKENITYAMMLTMSLCNKKDQSSHELWLIPKKRK